MAEEEVHGPKELVERVEPEDDSDEELVRQQDSDAEEGRTTTWRSCVSTS